MVSGKIDRASLTTGRLNTRTTGQQWRPVIFFPLLLILLLAASEAVWITLLKFDAVNGTRAALTFLALLEVLFTLFALLCAMELFPAIHRRTRGGRTRDASSAPLRWRIFGGPVRVAQALNFNKQSLLEEKI